MGLLDIFFPSSNDSDEDITVDIGKLLWKPSQDEKIFVAHEKCNILTENGESLASTQSFTCCVTNKGVVLVPEGDCKMEKIIVGVGLSVLGVKGIFKRLTLESIYGSYINYPIYISRADIKSAELDCYTVLNGNFIRNFVKIRINNEMLFLGVNEVTYGANIMGAIYNPQWYKD